MAGMLVVVAMAAAATADFSYKPGAPQVGEAVTFTADADCGSPTITCAWSFDGAPGGGGKSQDHVFVTAGDHVAALTTTEIDSAGGADVVETVSKTVTVAPAPPPPNKPPVARLSASAESVSRGQVVTFDASGSSDPDSGPQGLSFSFDTGRGDCDVAGAVARCRYGAVGTYRVVVRVSDGEDSATAFATVAVGNSDPVIRVTYADSPLSLDPVTFDASESSDPDGDPLSFRWSFGQSGPVVSQAFPVPGKQNVRLTVSDGVADGRPAVTKVLPITVRNRPPVAAFSFAPDPIPLGAPTTFVSASVDPENRLRDLRWDLDDNGSTDGTGPSFTYTFTSPGKRVMRLRVRDQDGGKVETKLTLVPNNKAPVAGFTFDPATPAPNTPVTFRAAASDPDGTITNLAWDLDDDGEFDDAAGPSAVRSFGEPGAYNVALEATDNDGSTVVSRQQVVVDAGGLLGTSGSGLASGKPTAARKGPLMIKPFPVIRIAGKLTARGAVFDLITIRAPRGAKIVSRCVGRDCPTRRRKAQTARYMRMKTYERAYRAGTKLLFRVTSKRRIGKYTSITVRRGKAPSRKDLCLFPNKTRPRKCPTVTSAGGG